jgi:hypothetical protein
VDPLDHSIREFNPADGVWLPLERLFEQAFARRDPKRHYPAMFDLFARFREEDGSGVFWSALHGMEHVGGYEEMLLQSYQRSPSLMTRAMLRRLLKSGQTRIGGVSIVTLIST